jgi:HEAT repeat protein
MKTTAFRSLTSLLAAGAIALVSSAVIAGSEPQNTFGGRAKVYTQLDPGSLEEVTTPEQIKRVDDPNIAPTEIWRLLEHGERTECLDCIPIVSKLIYNNHAKTREIAAWWLRRRIFGVFGPGQVYAQTIQTLTDQGQPEEKRAYAAEAIGEFLSHSGLNEVSTALASDPSPKVRKAAAYALWRLNSAGTAGELGKAIGDPDVEVRMQALFTAGRVSAFNDVVAVTQRISDESPRVRKRAAETLGAMRAGDAVVGLIELTKPSSEADALVRAAAVAALGQIADPAAKDSVLAAQNDPDQFVRDAAKIALRRL